MELILKTQIRLEENGEKVKANKTGYNLADNCVNRHNSQMKPQQFNNNSIDNNML
jgi:hypothetical protein